MKVSLPQNVWHGDQPFLLTLPDSWRVEQPQIAGDRRSPLTRDQLEDALRNPIDSPPLAELAAGKKEAVIIFDDTSRATPVRPIAELILEQLSAAGMRCEQIRFVCALGAHGALRREDFVKKLGEDIVQRYLVCNHNAYENCVYCGKTSHNTPIWLNGEVAACDLKIGIGSITPHVYNGFGGGGKIILPGVAGIETIEANHRIAIDAMRANHVGPAACLGQLSNRAMREDIEEAARKVGFQFKADAILNSRLEIVGLFAGDPVEEYYAGVRAAQELYGAKSPQLKDLVIVNANAKATEASLAMYLAASSLKPGGTIIVVNNTPEGQVTHYLLGPMGEHCGGRMWKGPSRLSRMKQLILLSQYPDPMSGKWFCNDERLHWATDWNSALELLQNPQEPRDVLVLTDGTLQFYFGEEA